MRAVSREVEADHLENLVALRQTVIPLVAPLARQASYQSTGQMVERLQAMRKMMPMRKVRDIGSVEESVREVRQLAAALKVLQSTGLSEKLGQIDESREQDL